MSGGEIETYLYEAMKSIIADDKASVHPMLETPLSGSVYYKGTRPLQKEQGGTDKEDVIVACLAGNESQLQSGSCVVNVYIPDCLTNSGMYMRDKRRTDVVEAWLKTIPALLSVNDIYFKRSSMVLTIEEMSIHQHFVSLKMDFQLLNESYD